MDDNMIFGYVFEIIYKLFKVLFEKLKDTEIEF